MKTWLIEVRDSEHAEEIAAAIHKQVPGGRVKISSFCSRLPGQEQIMQAALMVQVREKDEELVAAVGRAVAAVRARAGREAIDAEFGQGDEGRS